MWQSHDVTLTKLKETRSTCIHSMNDKILGGRFRLREKIGSGSFGDIWLADDLKTGDSVAVKLEHANARVPQLNFETKVYSILDGGVNIPTMIDHGSDSKLEFLAMDLLGPSLESLFQKCHRKFSLKTVLMLADRMISSLEYMHTRHFIHRDIKPDNFAIGREGLSSRLYLFDFGLSKKYRDPNTLTHIPYCSGKALTGTARYASIKALRGVEQSRRDDMESLGYVFVYFLKGSLPWMGLQAKESNQKHQKILQVKSATSVSDLCRGLPSEFEEYLEAVKKLRFGERPPYEKYRGMFRDLFMRSGFVYDVVYDWDKDVKAEHEPRPNTAHLSSRKLVKEVSEEGKEKGKRIPIIHNARLVPCYNSGTRKGKNEVSAREKERKVKMSRTRIAKTPIARSRVPRTPMASGLRPFW